MNRRDTLILLAAAISVASPLGTLLAAAAPKVVVHKSATCGCCKLWVKHLEQAGFAVEAIDHDDLAPIKARLGVPAGRESCHTAEVSGYFIEGHVPAVDIQRLLRERPKAKGLTVPGMPLGSPGMEVSSGAVDAYDVLLVGTTGAVSKYAHHP